MKPALPGRSGGRGSTTESPSISAYDLGGLAYRSAPHFGHHEGRCSTGFWSERGAQPHARQRLALGDTQVLERRARFILLKIPARRSKPNARPETRRTYHLGR